MNTTPAHPAAAKAAGTMSKRQESLLPRISNAQAQQTTEVPEFPVLRSRNQMPTGICAFAYSRSSQKKGGPSNVTASQY
jgi:hypothetical protein